MHVDGRRHAVVPQRLADHGADGEVGHVVIVHHVEVHDVRARRQHIIHLCWSIDDDVGLVIYGVAS